MVFSLEFKNGKKFFTAKDAQQAEDYAIDIKNFHKESENLYVCPILVATDAEEITDQSKECYSDKQIYLQKENINTLISKVNEIVDEYGTDEKIDFDKWFNSPYYPTPTIISAAVEAYITHSLTSNPTSVFPAPGTPVTKQIYFLFSFLAFFIKFVISFSHASISS